MIETEQEHYTETVFGTARDGVLYLSEEVMRSAKIKPGDKVVITPDKHKFIVHVVYGNGPSTGGQP
jgi:hypothetical protein